MRTTIEIPDDLYRTLKARAGLSGVTLRELVQRLIEEGLHPAAPRSVHKHGAPPVIIPCRGVPIPALSRAELKGIEEQEDEAKHG
jgi:hypothetical protein